MIDHAHRGTTDHFFVERIARNNPFTMETSHIHDEYELYYLIEGSGAYHIDGKEFSIKKGNLVVLNKNLIHRTFYEPDQAHERFLIEFKSNRITQQLEKFLNLELNNFFQKYTGIYFVEPDQQLQILDLFKTILTETQQKTDHYQQVIALKLTELFLTIMRLERSYSGDKHENPLKSTKERLVQKAIVFIHQHLTEEIQLQSIANALYVNKSYLSRVFKESTTLTTSEYINLERIRIAKRYLKISSLSIEEVAQDVGYRQNSYFIKVFKKYTELTPLQYRKQTQTTATNIRQINQ